MRYRNHRLALPAILLLTSCLADRPTETLGGRRTVAATRQRDAEVNAMPPQSCPTCIVGPMTFTRVRGAPDVDTVVFAAAGGFKFVVDVSDMNTQGSSGSLELNGQPLVARSGSPDHFNGTITLLDTNALVVRLTGKPGSSVRVAVWPVKPVLLSSVTLSAGSEVELDGAARVFDATIRNLTALPISDVDIQAWIIQPNARRAAGRQLVACGGALGTLPRGSCVLQGNRLAPSNAAAGFGTLVPGSGLAVIQVRQDASVVLDSVAIPVILTPAAIGVRSVTVVPADAMILPGGHTSFAAIVDASAGIPTTVYWSSSNPAVVIDSNGVATGFGPSGTTATIVASSRADPSKTGSAQLGIHELTIIEPERPTVVSTGAVQPPANPTTVRITVSLRCANLVSGSPFDHVEFFAISPLGVVFKIGSSSSLYTVIDGSGNRFLRWFIDWTPGTAYGLGTQTIYAAAYDPAGAVLQTPQNLFITTVTP